MLPLRCTGGQEANKTDAARAYLCLEQDSRAFIRGHGGAPAAPAGCQRESHMATCNAGRLLRNRYRARNKLAGPKKGGVDLRNRKRAGGHPGLAILLRRLLRRSSIILGDDLCSGGHCGCCAAIPQRNGAIHKWAQIPEPCRGLSFAAATRGHYGGGHSMAIDA